MVVQKYADFSGRATRIELLIILAIAIGAGLIGGWIDEMDGTRNVVTARMGIWELSTFLVFLLPMVSVGVRRLHDTGRSGWWLLMLYIPYIGWLASEGNGPAELLTLGGVLVGAVALMVLFGLPGDKDDNRFGIANTPPMRP
jgi:uncharacterized membrane protein YhaH (DUF805 family)